MSGSCCTEFGNTLNLGHVGELNVRAREVTVVSAPPPPSRPTSKKKKKKRRCSLFQALWGRKRNKSGKGAKGKRKCGNRRRRRACSSDSEDNCLRAFRECDCQQPPSKTSPPPPPPPPPATHSYWTQTSSSMNQLGGPPPPPYSSYWTQTSPSVYHMPPARPHTTYWTQTDFPPPPPAQAGPRSNS